MSKPNWQAKFLKRLGFEPGAPEARYALAGKSKHERGRSKPRHHRRKRKTAQRMARATRRRVRYGLRTRRSRR